MIRRQPKMPKTLWDQAATNGNPPRVELEIHEVLRGDAKVDRTRGFERCIAE